VRAIIARSAFFWKRTRAPANTFSGGDGIPRLLPIRFPAERAKRSLNDLTAQYPKSVQAELARAELQKLPK
jgi:hypothetical protein